MVEGEAVSLSCAASGVPDPSYVFRKVSFCSVNNMDHKTICMLHSDYMLIVYIFIS